MTNKENHYRMWTWLAENPEMDKCDWPEWDFNGGEVPEVEFSCFACEEAGGMGHRDCGKCPIEWQDEASNHAKDTMQCINTDTIYDKFESHEELGITLGERSALALQIRDMWK